MSGFDPFSSGLATEDKPASSKEAKFDPFALGLATPNQGKKGFDPFASGLASETDEQGNPLTQQVDVNGHDLTIPSDAALQKKEAQGLDLSNAGSEALQIAGALGKGGLKLGQSIVKANPIAQAIQAVVDTAQGKDPSVNYEKIKNDLLTSVASIGEAGLQGAEFGRKIISNAGSAIADKFYTPEEEANRELERARNNAAMSSYRQEVPHLAQLAGTARAYVKGEDQRLAAEQGTASLIDPEQVAAAGFFVDPISIATGAVSNLSKVMGMGSRAEKVAEIASAIEKASLAKDFATVEKLKPLLDIAKNAPTSVLERLSSLKDRIPSITEAGLYGGEKIAQAGSYLANKTGELLKESPGLSTLAGAGIGAYEAPEGERLKGAFYGGVVGAHLPQLAKAGEALGSARQVLGGLRDISKAGGGTRAFVQQAAQRSADPMAETLFRSAALPGEVGTGIKGTAGKLAGYGLRGASTFGSQVVDPLTRSALIGGVLGYANDPTNQGIESGIGAGLAYGGIGHALGRAGVAITGVDSEATKKFADSFTSKLDPKQRAVVENAPMSDFQKSNIGQVRDLIKVANPDTDIQFLNQDDYLASLKNNKQDEVISNGVFIKQGEKGNPTILINMDSPNVATLAHEGLGHLFDVLLPEGDNESRVSAFNQLKEHWTGRYIETPEGKIVQEKAPALSQEQIKDLSYLYEKKLGRNVFERDSGGNLTDNGTNHLLNELSADSRDQFLRNAMRSNKDVLDYAKSIVSMDDKKIQSNLDKSTGSMLFDGQISNDPTVERAVAESIIDSVANNADHGLGDVKEGGIKIGKETLVNNAKSLKTELGQARKGDSIEAMDAANLKLKEALATGVFKTRSRSDIEVNGEARKRAIIKYGPQATNEQIYIESKNVPRQEVSYVAGGYPEIMTASERKRSDQNVVKIVSDILKQTPSDDPRAMKIAGEKGEEARFEGRYFDDAQMEAIQNTPDEILPPNVKDNLLFLNEATKAGDGRPFILDYFAATKGGRNNVSAARSFKNIGIGGFAVSYKNNFLARAFDRGGFYKAANKEASKPVGKSQVLEAFRDINEPDYSLAAMRFEQATQKYLQNHSDGMPGATGLNPDPMKSIMQRNAINSFFGINKGDQNPFTVENPTTNQFFRSLRLDRMVNLRNGAGEPLQYPVNELQKGNYMPAQPENFENNKNKEKNSLSFPKNEGIVNPNDLPTLNNQPSSNYEPDTLPPAAQQGNSGGSLAAATAIASGSHRTISKAANAPEWTSIKNEGQKRAYRNDIETLARKQESEDLKQWASNNGKLFEDDAFELERELQRRSQNLDKPYEGMEHNALYDPNSDNWIKKNSLVFDGTFLNYFHRLALQNYLFPEAPVQLIGFTENKQGVLNPLISQRNVVGEKVHTRDVVEHMKQLGFEAKKDENDGYVNKDLGVEVLDVHDKNAVRLPSGKIAIFDPVIKLMPDKKMERLGKKLTSIPSSIPDINKGNFMPADFSEKTLKQAELLLPNNFWNVYGEILSKLKQTKFSDTAERIDLENRQQYMERLFREKTGLGNGGVAAYVNMKDREFNQGNKE